MMGVKLPSSIWGAGFGRISCSMIPAEEELRRKRHKYLEKTWLPFGECMGISDAQVDVFGYFRDGGTLPHRGNSEAETHHGSWTISSR